MFSSLSLVEASLKLAEPVTTIGSFAERIHQQELRVDVAHVRVELERLAFVSFAHW